MSNDGILYKDVQKWEKYFSSPFYIFIFAPVFLENTIMDKKVISTMLADDDLYVSPKCEVIGLDCECSILSNSMETAGSHDGFTESDWGGKWD